MDEEKPKPIWTPEQQEYLAKMERALVDADRKARWAGFEIIAMKNRILALEEIIYGAGRPVS